MSKQAFVHFIKPRRSVLMLFGSLLFIAYAGYTSTYAFTCGGGGSKCTSTDIQKPFLYDQLRAFWFLWLVWVFLILPFIPFILLVPAALVLPVGGVVSTVYFYFLSCMIAYPLEKVLTRIVKYYDGGPPEDVRS